MKYLYILFVIVFVQLEGFAQKVNHPSLFFTYKRISEVKQRMKSENVLVEAWGQLLQSAENKLKKRNLGDADYLSLAYLMTGDSAYANCLREILLESIQDETWGNEEMLSREPAWRADLNLSRKAFYAAIAYDAIYHDLSVAERKKIAKKLNILALEPCMGDWLLEPTRIHSLNSMGHNWWTSCVCMGGILALSLQNEIPQAREMVKILNERLPEWFSFVGDVLQQKPKTFDADGGMYESLNYANFGVQEALLFRLACQNMNPSMQTPNIPALALLPEYFIQVCYPRTGILYSLNFGDSHKYVAAESSMMLLYALGMKDDNIRWYINQVKQGQHRDGYFLNRPMGFLYTPKMDDLPMTPNLKKSKLYADLGWAVMRNSWKKDATMLAVKSGYTWNHSHADANSFILYHKGIDIIKDGGHCWYPNAAYREYFFQSEAHNVVLFNGKGQMREQQYYGSSLRGNLHHLLDNGSMKYIMANGTGPYSDQFSRNFRHFLWIDNVIYIIDDLKTHDVGHFEWLWHPGGEAQKKGVDLIIDNGASSVVVRPLFPQMLAKSNFVHDYPDDLYWEIKEGPTEDLKSTENYYSFHLPAKVDRVKGVTAIILKDSAQQKVLPQIERREGKNWIGLRVRDKGKITDIYINQLADGRLMHSNSWVKADGWETDAYMWMVRYDEGTDPKDSEECFIGYGSALRWEGNTYFSSLSKLFVMQRNDNEVLDVKVEGQSHINVMLANIKRPQKLFVNGKQTQVKYEKGKLNIRESLQ